MKDCGQALQINMQPVVDCQNIQDFAGQRPAGQQQDFSALLGVHSMQGQVLVIGRFHSFFHAELAFGSASSNTRAAFRGTLRYKVNRPIGYAYGP